MPGRYIYEYRETRLTYEYPTLSILDFSDEELDKSDNPFAQVVLVAKTSLLEEEIPEEDLLELKLLIASKLQEKGFGKLKTLAILNFLRNYVLFDNPEMNRKFDQRFKLNDKYNVMDTLEYVRKEAKEESLAAVVNNLVATTEFSDERIASIAGVSVAFVKAVRQGKKK